MTSFASIQLMGAFLISLLVHGALLLIQFVPNTNPKWADNNLGLDVILVNTEDEETPLSPKAWAQVNLEGGGNASSGRATLPLSAGLFNERNEKVGQAQRAKTVLDKMSWHLITTPYSLAWQMNDQPDVLSSDARLQSTVEDAAMEQVMTRLSAEIEKEVHTQNERPHKILIGPSTKEVIYAQYYKRMQQRIEARGTAHFPEHLGKKMYGELIVSIPVLKEGALYEKMGGPKIEQSSGNKLLDQAALNIIRRAAPFGQMPPAMGALTQKDVWIVVTRFHFTRSNNGSRELVAHIKSSS